MNESKEICLFYDKPIKYKKLSIYPVLMYDYIQFHFYVQCMLLDKNSIPDINVISMNYLDYLYYLSDKDSKSPYLYMLKELLKIVLHIDNDDSFGFYKSAEGKSFIRINGDDYDANDLSQITDIIFEQNGIEHIDDSIQKEVRDAMDKAMDYKMKQNSNKICSLEEQMICVLISTSLKLEDIYNLTIRKFSKILRRVDAKLHYQIYKSAEMSGMVTFKEGNPIQHWMSDLTNEDKYQDVKVDSDAMKNKIDGLSSAIT